MTQNSTIQYWSPRTPLIGWFEEKFDFENKVELIKNYWWISIILSVIYLVLVFFGVQFMKKRSAFDLRKPLAIWSAALAIFSFYGTIHLLPEALYALNQSPHYFFCSKKSIVHNRTLQFWIYLFSVSKVIEFGDTFFIVLRKQKLSFLHYIHHALTLIFAMYTFGENGALMRMGASMNYTIHTIMYSYYALKALRFRISKFISILITILQILQMIIGFYGMLYAFKQTLSSKGQCDATPFNAAFGVFIYFLFLTLFLNFFVQSYLFCAPSIKDETKKQT